MTVAGKNQGCVFFHPTPGQIPDVPAAITVGVAAAALQAVVPVAYGGERSCCVSWLSRNRVPPDLVMVYEVFTDSAPPEFDGSEAMTVANYTSGKFSETTKMITKQRRMADLFSIGSLCHVHVKVHSVTFAVPHDPKARPFVVLVVSATPVVRTVTKPGVCNTCSRMTHRPFSDCQRMEQCQRCGMFQILPAGERVDGGFVEDADDADDSGNTDDDIGT